MHKPAQIELQLDRPQLPYSEILGPIIAGGSPAHYRRRQPNLTKKGPYKHKDTKDINKGRDTLVEVLQSLQHSQQQMMEEICQLKADKTKEKGSQHDPDHAIDGGETLAGGVPRNTGQRFITMAEVAALLEQEKARTPKERFYARRPPYLLKVLKIGRAHV